MGDRKETRSRFIELRRAMMDDGIRLGLPYSFEKDLHYLSARIDGEGTSFFKVTLPLLGKALDRGLVSGTFSCPTNFSLIKGTRLPTLCNKVFNLIFREDGSLRDEPNLHAIQHLRQFLSFDSKMVLPVSDQSSEEAVTGFADRMRELRRYRIQTDSPVLLEAQRLLTWVLKGLDLSVIKPGHGPGSVSEKLNRFERWEFNTWLTKAERYYPHMSYGVHSLRALVDRSGPPIRWIPKSITRICLVPKDFKGPRLISAECAVNQYLQQGQMKKMMDYFQYHWLLRRSIRLEDQTFNRSIAASSFNNGLATLDLSNASDTLSVPLFWFLFSGVPKLRRLLMCTRSDFARFEQLLIKITSFAPMGSATCFPVETLIFWALAMASVRINRPSSPTFPGCTTSNSSVHQRKYLDWREISSSVAVFGDDIVIPVDCLETLTSTLSSIGCSPNLSKTCWKTPFRESCGGEWFSGTSVTIIRNRKYHYEEKKKIAHYPVLLDLQRKFYAKGYKSTSDLLRKLAEEIWPIYVRSFQEIPVDANLQDIPSDSPFECAYGSCHSYSKNLKTRFNRDYQRLEYRIPVIYQPSLKWGSGSYARLFARLSDDQADRIATRDCKVKVAWRFLPAYMGLASPIEA